MPESFLWLILQACWLTIEYQVVQYLPNASISKQFASILLATLQLIQVPPVWIDDHQNKDAKLQYRSTHFWACPSMSYGRRHCLCVRLLPLHVMFCCSSRNINANIFIFCSMILSFGLYTRWVHPKYIWSRNDAASSISTFYNNYFHMKAMFCFFPAVFNSSTCTERNNPCFRWTTYIPNSEISSIQVLTKLFRIVSPIEFQPMGAHASFVQEVPRDLLCLVVILSIYVVEDVS